jgi:hypothetical protein
MQFSGGLVVRLVLHFFENINMAHRDSIAFVRKPSPEYAP